MKKTPPQLVIYDLDGTLIDSVPDIARSLNQALQEAGYKTVACAHVGLWIGNGSLMLVTRALTHLNIPANILEAIHSRFLHHYNAQVKSSDTNNAMPPKTFAGTHELMALFARHGIPQAVATNKPQQFVPGILKAEGLAPFVSAIVGGNSLPECKPSPMPLLSLCARFHCPPANAIMIGDSTADAKSAQNAGIPCWLIEQGYAQGADLHQLGAQSVFKNTQQLLEAVYPLFEAKSF